MSDPSAAPVTEVVATVTGTIDDVTVTVPKGTLIIRAAERIGIDIPRFCDHPLLDPVAACRMCLVDIEGMPKPQPSCAVPLGDGMEVRTGQTSAVADKAQQGVMEFLLINHPLDCPICDKGGECPLQNQEMSNGRGESRYSGAKRTFAKPISVSEQILLDRERCISCTRCVRFADEIAGDPLIDLKERGAEQQIAIGDQPFDSYFSGNTIQICPVGALTSADYRFRARPFDLVSVPTVCEHCAAGCAMRTDVRRERVQRRLAGDDALVNEEWNCDKGRFAFKYLDSRRICVPLIRENGEFREASWPEAIEFAAEGLAPVRGRVAVVPGGRLTREDAYAYAKFARISLATDDIDFRTRPASSEEADFLAARVAGTGLGVTYADLDAAPIVLLVGLEPEDESPILFLRLRQAVRRHGTRVAAVAPWATPGLLKTSATLLPTVPGAEAGVLDALATGGPDLDDAATTISAALREPGAVVLVGERLATSKGGWSAAHALAEQTGARLAWVPRRAGERGALDAGALRGLLPGGASLTDPVAAQAVAEVWGVSRGQIPARTGRTLSEAVAAALSGESQAPMAAVVGGMDVDDLASPAAFRGFLRQARFVVSLETRHSAVTAEADVVLPVAVDTERSGSYVNWEGRVRHFPKASRQEYSLTDGQVLGLISEKLGSPIGNGDPASLAAELESIPGVTAGRPAPSPVAPDPDPAAPAQGQAVLSTWRELLDEGSMQQEAHFLAGTRRQSVARMSAATAAGIGAVSGGEVEVSTDRGEVALPLVLTEMPDGVVWIPANSVGSEVYRELGTVEGRLVRIAAGGPR
ncbi:MAG: NADH-quinone oxidoreductase subunit G [Candidatus Nanopelagicales bacterium]|nr:NADH-quinone oxidoreductase subunit G [Candidatus Nanopelagicales bacterium]